MFLVSKTLKGMVNACTRITGGLDNDFNARVRNEIFARGRNGCLATLEGFIEGKVTELVLWEAYAPK